MEIREAIQQISDIQRQMARCKVFRGYRSLTVAFSGLLALVAATVQSQWLASPATELTRYLCLWIGVALVIVTVAVAELVWRAKRAGPGLVREMTRLAGEQLLPCLAIGALITAFIYRSAPSVAWMLPGLWSLIFSLGIFASWRLLPAPVVWAGVYYVICGCCCLHWGQGDQALAAWQMAISFGGGQFLSAAILYWNLERNHAS